jgi:WD40 repeat protein
MRLSPFFISVKWCGGNINRLFTGGVDCVVHMYDVQQLREVGMREGYTPAKKDEDYYHKDAVITDLLPIPELGLLASAGMSSRSPQSSSDNKICLWRMDTLQPKPPLIGHDRGVYSLDWYKDNHLILSAGLDHDVMIWNPHVNKKIFALKGHNHSLVGVKWMPGTNQIISGDISGMFRVWDVRTFATI